MSKTVADIGYDGVVGVGVGGTCVGVAVGGTEVGVAVGAAALVAVAVGAGVVAVGVATTVLVGDGAVVPVAVASAVFVGLPGVRAGVLLAVGRAVGDPSAVVDATAEGEAPDGVSPSFDPLSSPPQPATSRAATAAAKASRFTVDASL